LWNAVRFAEMDGVFSAIDAPRPAPRHVVNRWIIGELARATTALDESLAGFRFNEAAQGLYAFTWGRLCDWYVEFAKPLFDGEYAEETRATMRIVIEQTVALLHPIMPFITEEIWALTGNRAQMLAVSDWPQPAPDWIDPEADREISRVIALIEGVRSARAQMGVPAGARLDLIVTEADAAMRAALAANGAVIERLARTNPARDGQMGPGMIAVTAAGASFALPIGALIDVAAETARLSKTREKTEKDATGLRKRLENPKFTANADPEVIGETRDKLAALDEDLARLDAALAQLAGLSAQ